MSTTSEATLNDHAAQKKPGRAFQALLLATFPFCGASMILTVGTAILGGTR